MGHSNRTLVKRLKLLCDKFNKFKILWRFFLSILAVGSGFDPLRSMEKDTL